MTILALALYALLILAATLAGDKARPLVNEIRWRVCKLWHTQINPVLKGQSTRRVERIYEMQHLMLFDPDPPPNDEDEGDDGGSEG